VSRARRTRVRGSGSQREIWTIVIGAVLCAAGILLALAVMRKPGNHPLYDFRGGLFNAGLDILHGRSPYHAGFLAHQVAIMKAGGIARGETASTAFSIPVYPAVANLAIVPLSLLPLWLAGTVYTAASVAAMVGGVRLLGVRDWRCLLVVVVSWPFLYGLYLGAVGPFLVLGIGIAWHWRDRLWPPACAIAALVAVKVFPWPLGVWLLITRRFKALAVCVAIGVLATFGAWAAIGFDGLAQYPRLLSDISFLQEGRAVSAVSILLVGGVSTSVASAAAIVVALAILVVAWRVSRGPQGDARALGLAVIAALTATPIVWEHYMVLLFVPVALASARLSKVWLLPLCTPLLVVVSGALIPVSHRLGAHPPETLRAAVPWLLVEAAVAVALLRPRIDPRALVASPFVGARRTVPASVPPAAGAAESA
jgi:hypothetical protein